MAHLSRSEPLRRRPGRGRLQPTVRTFPFSPSTSPPSFRRSAKPAIVPVRSRRCRSSPSRRRGRGRGPSRRGSTRVRCRRGTSTRLLASGVQGRPSLTDEQIETIARWVDRGAPQGDPKDMPATRAWPTAQGWNYAELVRPEEPDLIVRSTPWTQKARGQRHLVEAGRRHRPHRAALGASDRECGRARSRAARSRTTPTRHPAGRSRRTGRGDDPRTLQRMGCRQRAS